MTHPLSYLELFQRIANAAQEWNRELENKED